MSSQPRDKLFAFQQGIAAFLSELREVYFKPEVKMNFTFIARNPNDPEMDIFVSEEEDLDELIKFLERTRAREIVEFKKESSS